MGQQTRRRWVSWLVAGLVAGCAVPPTLLPVAPAGLQAAKGPLGTANLALFIGMDDYNGNTLGEIQVTHRQLANVGSTPRFGLFLSGDSDVRNDGFRTRVTRGQAWQQGFEAQGELNTAHSPALRDYVRWVGRQQPAAATHLAISTHGGGYRGILWDYDGSANPNLPAASMSLQKAFKALSKGYEGSRIASLTFDACMMATIEVGEALKGTVATFTGSEDFSFGGSIPWDRIATTAQSGPALSGEGFAKLVTETVIRHGRWGDQGSLVWSAIRLDKDFDRLVKDVDRLAGALRSALKSERPAVLAAVRETRQFTAMARYADQYGDFYQRDLIDLCQALRRHSRDPHVRAAAEAVEAGVRRVLIAFAKHPSVTMANGLAIYLPHNLPPGQAGQALSEYRRSLFAKHTRWDEFLLELNAVPTGLRAG